jgi:hypothetical protein
MYKRFAPPPGDATNDQKVFASFFKKKCCLLFFFEKKNQKTFVYFSSDSTGRFGYFRSSPKSTPVRFGDRGRQLSLPLSPTP